MESTNDLAVIILQICNTVGTLNVEHSKDYCSD